MTEQHTLWARLRGPEGIARGLITLVGVAGLAWITGLAMLGFDAYPLIATARWEGLGDLWRLVSTELMEGRYPDGHFYRPLVHLSFALDRALHGWAPAGYHLTNLLTALASAQLLFTLLRRWTPSGIWLAAGLSIWFLGHPLQAEILPFPARRADNLSILLVLATLAAVPGPDQALTRCRAALMLLCAWAAVAAKETGAIAALLAPALAWMGSPQRSWRSTLAGAPAVVGVLLAVGARQLVLEGLAGHADSGLMAAFRLQPDEYLWRILYPQPALGWGAWITPAIWITSALLAGLGLLGPARRGALAALTWLGALLLVSSLAGRVHDWYVLQFVPPYAILIASALGHPRAKLGVAALSAPWLVMAVAHGPLARHYENLEDGSKLLAQTLEQVDGLVERSPQAARTRLNPWVPLLPPREDRSELRIVPLAQLYSLEAYLELIAPERTTRVVRWEQGNAAEEPGTWTLELVQQPPPSWVRFR